MSKLNHETKFGLVVTLHELHILTEIVASKLRATVINDRPPAVKIVAMLDGRLLVEVEETDENDRDSEVDLYSLNGRIVSAGRPLIEKRAVTMTDVALSLAELLLLKDHLVKHATDIDAPESPVSLLQKINERIKEIEQRPVVSLSTDGYPTYSDHPFHVYGSGEDNILIAVKQFASEAEAEAWIAPLNLERPGHYMVIHESEFDEGA